jgi:hypothetical protein
MARPRDDSFDAAMHYNEILARRIVAEVARTSADGGVLQPVMLHEVARRLKIDEASAESAMYRAVAERWLIVDLHYIAFGSPTPAGAWWKRASAECGIGGRHSRSLAGDTFPRRTNLRCCSPRPIKGLIL